MKRILNVLEGQVAYRRMLVVLFHARLVTIAYFLAFLGSSPESVRLPSG